MITESQIIKDAQDTVDQDTLDLLHSDLDNWRRILIELIDKVEQQITARKATLLQMQQSCFGQENGKKAYLVEKTRYDSWHVNALDLKRRLTGRLIYVNTQIRNKSVEQNNVKTTAVTQLLEQAARLVPDIGEGGFWHQRYKEYLNGNKR